MDACHAGYSERRWAEVCQFAAVLVVEQDAPVHIALAEARRRVARAD